MEQSIKTRARAGYGIDRRVVGTGKDTDDLYGCGQGWTRARARASRTYRILSIKHREAADGPSQKYANETVDIGASSYSYSMPGTLAYACVWGVRRYRSLRARSEGGGATRLRVGPCLTADSEASFELQGKNAEKARCGDGSSDGSNSSG